MKALVKTATGPGNVQICEVKEPTPSRCQVKIAIKYAGICGTDIKIRNGTAPSNPPVILGHEFCGIIEEVGKDVKNFKVGNRVVSETAASICGFCFYCRTGNYMMCENRLSAGYGVDGGFAEFCVIREEAIHRLPDEVTFKQGALTEPLAVSVHAVLERTKVQTGDFVLVSGVGTIGLLTAFVAKSAGAYVILAGTSVDTERLKVGEKLGVNVIINVEKEDLYSLVKRDTNGYGVDYAFECAGVAPSVSQCIKCLRKGGSMVQTGLLEKPFQVDFNDLTRRELRLVGTFGHKWKSWETSIRLLKHFGKKIEKVISYECSLEEWEAAFKDAENKKGIKILLYP
jgi:L-iditol 2-dehydrogenase